MSKYIPVFVEGSKVQVNQSRYDELLHKEALLETIERLHNEMSDYAFRDAVRFIFKYEKGKNDE